MSLRGANAQDAKKEEMEPVLVETPYYDYYLYPNGIKVPIPHPTILLKEEPEYEHTTYQHHVPKVTYFNPPHISDIYDTPEIVYSAPNPGPFKYVAKAIVVFVDNDNKPLQMWEGPVKEVALRGGTTFAPPSIKLTIDNPTHTQVPQEEDKESLDE